jgi:STAS-like domain of unknown function (DUF4325)
MIVKVFEISGEYAIAADSDQKLYDQIHPELLDGKSIELDFAGVEIFASAFFNFAIGQLLSDISTDDLNRLLKITALNPNGSEILKHIIANAKRYYSDSHYQEAADEVMEEYASSFGA